MIYSIILSAYTLFLIYRIYKYKHNVIQEEKIDNEFAESVGYDPSTKSFKNNDPKSNSIETTLLKLHLQLSNFVI